MDIKHVSSAGSGVYTAAVPEKVAEESSKGAQSAIPDSVSDRKDEYIPAKYGQPIKAIYTKEEIQSLVEDAQTRKNDVVRMIVDMMQRQGTQSDFALGRLFVTPEVQSKAQAAIADDGEWGVNAVATRILDFAKALAGDDSSKIAELRDAVEKGFAAAGVKLGGKLPDVSQRTYTEVMKRFDDWEKEVGDVSSSANTATE